MEKQIQTFGEFKSELLSNSNLQDQFKQDPVAAIQQFQQQSPLATDKWIYRIVVLALGCTVVLVILGTIILYLSKVVSSDQGVPTILTSNRFGRHWGIGRALSTASKRQLIK